MHLSQVAISELQPNCTDVYAIHCLGWLFASAGKLLLGVCAIYYSTSSRPLLTQTHFFWRARGADQAR